ncbi:beta-galactosidase [Paenibacillus oryzisoli]|uniref:OmpL47-type beta-barrel domain-containing protein n=1 Tax=Paenibacillus oryzisoli TaxID=1850517 RepID=UPI003D281FFB
MGKASSWKAWKAWKAWKVGCSLALAWLLGMGGVFQSAAHGMQLEALSDGGSGTSVTGATYQTVTPVITAWDSFQHTFGGHTAIPVIHAGNIAIDGTLNEWGSYSGLHLPAASGQVVMSGWTGEADVSADVYLAYDDDFFYWAARVKDNVHTPVADSTMWRGDSIQFAFSPGGIYGPEYGINYMDGTAHLWQFSEGQAVAGKDQITAAASQQGNETVYEVKMPWMTISTGKPANGILPFTLLINDNDGAGRKGWIEWTPGIGKAKSPDDHARLQLIPAAEPWSFWVEGPGKTDTMIANDYKLYAVNWKNTPQTLELASEVLGVQQQVVIPGQSAAELTLPFTATEAKTYQLDFTMTDAVSGQTKQQSFQVEANLSAQAVGVILDSVNAKLPQLEQLLLQNEAQGLSTDYERINYTVIKDFIQYGKDDIANGRLSRAQYVAFELQRLYDEAMAKLQSYLSGAQAPQAAPRYVTGQSDISGYSFLGNTKVRSTGATERRPIFFTGYGHFNQVRSDIPKFQDLGANIIQIEMGPRDVIVDNKDFVNQYEVGRSGGVTASVNPVSGVSHSGDYSLRIVNSSPFQSNVYVNVGQTIPVEPNTTYTFKVWVKGENAKNVWFPGGAGWKQRKSFPSGTYNWTEVSYTYTTGAAETSYRLTVLSENAGTVWIDDLSVVKAGSAVNLVQNPGFEELGGYSENKPYIVSTKKIDSDIRQVLQRAADHDIAVNLLLSPHYFPAWALDKWPELKTTNSGGIKFSIMQPMARSIVEDYLRALIPQIRTYPSLHSVTLSNEPTYQANQDPYAVGAWQDYLSSIYNGDIQSLNLVYNKTYGSFAEVMMPAQITATPAAYDYVLFNQDYFARWHEWMAGIIHELAPELPMHAKIMGDPQGSLSWGIDVERFSGWSQINGNDNWNYINEGPKGFMEELSFYDLQTSFKQAPVFNSEHHVIADGDKSYIPEQADHVRTDLWQSSIHGESATTYWIWERTYDAASSREGSILHRPDVVADIGRTNLDLNRLAKEVTALQNEKPQVAILYSLASGVFTSDYAKVNLRAYEALSYSGRKAGYVSERQIASGGLNDYKLLIVPNAVRADASTLQGIRQFQEQGGKVLVIGSGSLKYSPHGEMLSTTDRDYIFAHAVTIASTDRTAEQIRLELLPLLENVDPGRIGLIDSVTQQPVYGVEWRSVDYDGAPLVNTVNYGSSSVTVSAERDGIPLTGFTNLITGETFAGTSFELQPLTPYLLQLRDTEPPVTTAAVQPGQPDGANGWYVHPVTLQLLAEDTQSGILGSEYRMNGDGGWHSYSGPITINQDGSYAVSIRSTDRAGNAETPQTVAVNLDQTAPSITVTLPNGNATYEGSGELTPLIEVDDNLSGVEGSATTVTLDTYAYAVGTAIPLYTLSPGMHTIVVSAGDKAGNMASVTIQFETVTGIPTLMAMVNRFAGSKEIDQPGIANSLQAKLRNGKVKPFIQEVEAQLGKHISDAAASFLLRDARYLLARLE